MRKLSFTVMISMILVVVYSAPCLAGWLIFHKPGFKGKVIDAETKAPIEGAVVVVVYEKHVYGIAGGYSSVIKVKEILTDKNGMFSFSSYTTIIHPFSTEQEADFIIYKPGYGSFPDFTTCPPSAFPTDIIERFFWAETFGKQGEIRARLLTDGEWKDTTEKVTFGLVELPMLRTEKERLKTIPGRPTGFRSKELPLLFKAINEERIGFGLEPVGRPSR